MEPPGPPPPPPPPEPLRVPPPPPPPSPMGVPAGFRRRFCCEDEERKEPRLKSAVRGVGGIEEEEEVEAGVRAPEEGGARGGYTPRRLSRSGMSTCKKKVWEKIPSGCALSEVCSDGGGILFRSAAVRALV